MSSAPPFDAVEDIYHALSTKHIDVDIFVSIDDLLTEAILRSHLHIKHSILKLCQEDITTIEFYAERIPALRKVYKDHKRQFKFANQAKWQEAGELCAQAAYGILLPHPFRTHIYQPKMDALLWYVQTFFIQLF
jgi:hypothetical protein